MSRIDDIEARALAAPPGPWRNDKHGDIVGADGAPAITQCMNDDRASYLQLSRCGAFVLNAREDVLYLVARTRNLEVAARDLVDSISASPSALSEIDPSDLAAVLAEPA